MNFDTFIAKYNGKGIDTDMAYGFQLMDLWYNVYMKILTIESKAYGLIKVKLDNADYDKVVSMGKWSASKDRGKYYFHKRLSKTKKITLHRYLMGLPVGKYVDHIDGDTLNNQKSNLRVCSNGDNLRNGKLRPNNKTGYTGVVSRRGKYDARIRVNYKIISITGFKTFEEALGARVALESEYWYGNVI